MSLGFSIPVHKLELEGNTMFFREARIGVIKKAQEMDSSLRSNEIFKQMYCDKNGNKIEVTDKEIDELPARVAMEILTFIANLNKPQKKS